MPLIPLAEQVGPTTVRYTWSGTAPFDVWLKGERLAYQTAATEFVVEYYGQDAEPWIEVLDADDVSPAQSELYSPRLRLQWRGQTDADVYLIQRYDDDEAEWIDKQMVREMGRGYSWTRTTPEANGTTPQWRVMAQDARGYQSEVRSFTREVVCNPSTPAVSGVYDEGTGEITVDS